MKGPPQADPAVVPVLHVDATVRTGSRTAELARWLLGRMGGPALRRREAAR